MNTEQPLPVQPGPLKDSIRDLALFQQLYTPSDELLWTYFNVRVLQNEPVKLTDFVRQKGLTGVPYGHVSRVAVG